MSQACAAALLPCCTRCFTAVTDGIAVIGSKNYIAGGCKCFHQKARLRCTTMKAVRKDNDWLLDGLLRLLRPYGHLQACELDCLF